MTESVERDSRWARLKGKLTYANAMATIAAFLALGGVGYAAADSLHELNREQNRPLWGGRSYTVRTIVETSRNVYGSVFCDEFDVPIGGGYATPTGTPLEVVRNAPDKAEGEDPGTTVRGWTVVWLGTPGLRGGVTIQVRCADFLGLNENSVTPGN